MRIHLHFCSLSSGVAPANQIKERPIRKPVREFRVFLWFRSVFSWKKRGEFTKTPEIRELHQFLNSPCFFYSRKNTPNSQKHPQFANWLENQPFFSLVWRGGPRYLELTTLDVLKWLIPFLCQNVYPAIACISTDAYISISCCLCPPCRSSSVNISWLFAAIRSGKSPWEFSDILGSAKHPEGPGLNKFNLDSLKLSIRNERFNREWFSHSGPLSGP